MAMRWSRTSTELAAVHLGPGTLYGALSRLEEQGLIEPAAEQGRRRPYRITAAGADAHWRAS